MKARFGAQEREATWPILCGSCDHHIGTITTMVLAAVTKHQDYVTGGGSEPHVGYLSSLPGLRRLDPDAADGVPRYGVREGTFRRGRDPMRRPSWRGEFMASQKQTFGNDGLIAFGEESIEQAIHARYYTYCVNCRRRNLVDAANLSP